MLYFDSYARILVGHKSCVRQHVSIWRSVPAMQLNYLIDQIYYLAENMCVKWIWNL